MDYILLVVILFLLGYIVYKDYSYAKEREKLQMKLMSKDLAEYVEATKDVPEDSEDTDDPYIPAEDATVEQILKAKP